VALSNVEKQLVGLAASLPRTDPVLQMLLRVCDMESAPVGIGITALLDGYLIRGTLMGTARYAEQLEQGFDGGLADAIQRYGADDPRGMAAEVFRSVLSGRFSKDVAEGYESQDRHHKAMEEIAAEKGVSVDELKLDDLPDDMALTEIVRTGSRSVLTLENAVLLVPPMLREEPLGVVRIHTSQIAAWWTSMGSGEDENDEPLVAYGR
jgi:hypothetical protein